MSTWMHQLYKRGDRQKGSGGIHPVLRITHRLCCVDTLETFLPVMNQFIFRSWWDVTCRTCIVYVLKSISLFLMKTDNRTCDNGASNRKLRKREIHGSSVATNQKWNYQSGDRICKSPWKSGWNRRKWNSKYIWKAPLLKSSHFLVIVNKVVCELKTSMSRSLFSSILRSHIPPSTLSVVDSN